MSRAEHLAEEAAHRIMYVNDEFEQSVACIVAVLMPDDTYQIMHATHGYNESYILSYLALMTQDVITSHVRGR